VKLSASWRKCLVLQAGITLVFWIAMRWLAPALLLVFALAMILGVVWMARSFAIDRRNGAGALRMVLNMALAAAGFTAGWGFVLPAIAIASSVPTQGVGILVLLAPAFGLFSTGTMIHLRLGPFRTYLPPMERVRQILAENPGAYLGGAATESRIAEAERILGLTLPKSYREFLATWGDLEFRMRKYLGIPATMNMDHPTPADFVGTTLEAREQAGLPSQLVVCATRPDGPRACLNTFAMRDREAPVVLWDSASRTIVRTLAPTFAGFLRDRLEAVLKSSGKAFVQQNQHEAW